MSGFSADWLSLREGADHRARNVALREVLATHLSGRELVTVVDLACGAGSNLRGLAPHLRTRQHWRLVDHDPALLDAAREALLDWGDQADSGKTLRLTRQATAIEVAFQRSDLAVFDDAVISRDADLVTAAAFFDLVSEDWIESFTATLATRGLPLYAVLTYSGAERWSPSHAADADMLAAFHAHQRRDKGFGPAAGPLAGGALAEALRRRGYRVSTADSPWRLGRKDAPLIEALADGAAQAAAETGLVSASVIEDWRRVRRVAESCEIGHVDLFAAPLTEAR